MSWLENQTKLKTLRPAPAACDLGYGRGHLFRAGGRAAALCSWIRPQHADGVGGGWRGRTATLCRASRWVSGPKMAGRRARKRDARRRPGLALLCRFTGGQTDVTMFPFSFKIEFAAGATIWSGKDYERLSSVFEICAVKCPGSPQKPAQGASVFIY